jgi:hypothetical protein
MDNILRQFYNNETTREGVKGFLIDNLKQIAIDRTFDNKDIGGIADAKECIDKAFDKLEELYRAKPEIPDINSR